MLGDILGIILTVETGLAALYVICRSVYMNILFTLSYTVTSAQDALLLGQRLSAARTRARKLHEEETRNREEVMLLRKQQQGVKDEARAILRSKTEALVEKEILIKRRHEKSSSSWLVS